MSIFTDNAFAFLTAEELAALTGRKHKAAQCAQLRKMALPFWINASGHPVVARAAIEGTNSKAHNVESRPWTPAPLR